MTTKINPCKDCGYASEGTYLKDGRCDKCIKRACQPGTSKIKGAIKVYLVKEGEHIDEVCLGHAHKDLINGYARANIDCDNGYFLTEAELEQIKSEIWEAAREVGVYDVHGHDMQVYIHSSLEDYELSKSTKKHPLDDNKLKQEIEK